MPATPREGVPVVGTCRHAHITETTSEPGKVTWRGECSNAKCKERVICRRKPADRTPAGDEPAGTPAEPPPNRARKVSWNAPQPKNSGPGSGSGTGSTPEPSGPPDGPSGDGGGSAGEPAPLTAQGQQAGQSTVSGSETPAGPPAQPGARRGRLAEHIHSRRAARAARPRPQYGTRFPWEQ